jgi:hypothetical protein
MWTTLLLLASGFSAPMLHAFEVGRAYAASRASPVILATPEDLAAADENVKELLQKVRRLTALLDEQEMVESQATGFEVALPVALSSLSAVAAARSFAMSQKLTRERDQLQVLENQLAETTPAPGFEAMDIELTKAINSRRRLGIVLGFAAVGFAASAASIAGWPNGWLDSREAAPRSSAITSSGLARVPVQVNAEEAVQVEAQAVARPEAERLTMEHAPAARPTSEPVVTARAEASRQLAAEVEQVRLRVERMARETAAADRPYAEREALALFFERLSELDESRRRSAAFFVAYLGTVAVTPWLYWLFGRGEDGADGSSSAGTNRTDLETIAKALRLDLNSGDAIARAKRNLRAIETTRAREKDVDPNPTTGPKTLADWPALSEAKARVQRAWQALKRAMGDTEEDIPERDANSTKRAEGQAAARKPGASPAKVDANDPTLHSKPHEAEPADRDADRDTDAPSSIWSRRLWLERIARTLFVLSFVPYFLPDEIKPESHRVGRSEDASNSLQNSLWRGGAAKPLDRSVEALFSSAMLTPEEADPRSHRPQ